MNYSFNIDIATEYDVEQAIFLENLYFWIRKNETNKKHIHEGRCWTYNSQEAYSELFPFWNRLKVKRIIDKLENNGLVLKGNFNKVNYDRTTWYALTDKGYELFGKKPLFKSEHSHCSELNNRLCKSEQPIPDINTDINTDNSVAAESEPAYKGKKYKISEDNRVTLYYKESIGRKPTNARKSVIVEFLNNGMEEDLLIEAIAKAVEGGYKKKWEYAESVIFNWLSERIYTIDDLMAKNKAFKLSKVKTYSKVTKEPVKADKKVYCGNCKNGWVMKLNGNDVERVKCECNK